MWDVITQPRYNFNGGFNELCSFGTGKYITLIYMDTIIFPCVS